MNLFSKKITCDVCGNQFKPGNRPDGLPNGVGFQLNNNRYFNVCSCCIMNNEQFAKTVKKAKNIKEGK